jgi:hypothetical protein
MRTVDPDSAVPTTIGWVLMAGDGGSVPVIAGLSGGTLSSTYAMLLEQAETFPAKSTAVAESIVVRLGGTSTVKLPSFRSCAGPETWN